MHPYINCLILAFIQGFVGDLIAQFIIEPKLTGKYEKWCWKRSARMIFQCVVINAIPIQTWFYFGVTAVQNWIKTWTSSSIINLIITVLIDQIPWSILINLYVLFTSNFIRLGDVKKALNFTKDNIWSVMCMNW